MHAFRYLFAITLIGISTLTAPAVMAQAPPAGPYEFWPGAQYNPAVPTIEKVTGHAPGERITSPAEIVKYFEALAAYAPDRVKVFDYARTFENRRLIYVAIGTPERIAQLDTLRQGNLKLAEPSLSDGDAKNLIATLPSFVWLAYGVHGNEISSSDAALLTAYHLLAANDPMVQNILAHDLVLIDPLENPDGRNRFVHNFEMAEGPTPDADPLAAEHNEPWVTGRANHYYQDMNRDWFALTQPETRGRVKALLEWLPQVYVDVHEMGADSTYFFSPESEPYNPQITKDQRNELSWFGRNNAKYFDRFGFLYFTKEGYDDFYPGYGAGWPIFYGGIGMTYEEASSRGLVMRRYDGTLLQYRDTVRHHFTTSLATLETAANHHDDLLFTFHRYRVTAVEEGRTEAVRGYVLLRNGDVSNADVLARTLMEQGIEVKRVAAAAKVDGHDVPAGSYVVPAAQPMKRLLRTLLDEKVEMEAEFVKEEEHRRVRKEGTEIYDVTAWSLPLLFNVETYAVKALPESTEALTVDGLPKGTFTGKTDAVYYLVPWNTNAAHLLSLALQRNLQVLTSDREFTHQGRTYPSGTLIISAKANPSQIEGQLRELSQLTGADVVATDDSWVDNGPSFGSRHVLAMKKPSIVIAWDSPTASTSAGALRFLLERRFGYPVTVIRTAQLARANLSRYNVIILPSGGSYTPTLGPVAARLKEWVRAGGVLIAAGNSVGFAADPKVGLLSLTAEEAFKDADGKDGAKAKKPAAPGEESKTPGTAIATDEDYAKALRAESEKPDPVQGVILKARVDQEVWLSAGVPKTVYALVEGNEIYSPLKIDKGVTAAYYAGPAEVLSSGYLWDDFRKQVAYKPLVVVEPNGSGFTIGFTVDPSFRTFLRGMDLFLMNAVFRAPAHARQ